ncbi:hypothetical protein HDU86_000803 [Geranomyces michiganensis]|nr:hypothetical protein HDU86_000803 [Geranomyces michiganensis]
MPGKRNPVGSHGTFDSFFNLNPSQRSPPILSLLSDDEDSVETPVNGRSRATSPATNTFRTILPTTRPTSSSSSTPRRRETDNGGHTPRAANAHRRARDSATRIPHETRKHVSVPEASMVLSDEDVPLMGRARKRRISRVIASSESLSPPPAKSRQSSGAAAVPEVLVPITIPTSLGRRCERSSDHAQKPFRRPQRPFAPVDDSSIGDDDDVDDVDSFDLASPIVVLDGSDRDFEEDLSESHLSHENIVQALSDKDDNAGEDNMKTDGLGGQAGSMPANPIIDRSNPGSDLIVVEGVRCASGDDPPGHSDATLYLPTTGIQLPKPDSASPSLPETMIPNKVPVPLFESPRNVPAVAAGPRTASQEPGAIQSPNNFTATYRQERVLESSGTPNDTPLKVLDAVTSAGPALGSRTDTNILREQEFAEVDPATMLENWYMSVVCDVEGDVARGFGASSPEVGTAYADAQTTHQAEQTEVSSEIVVASGDRSGISAKTSEPYPESIRPAVNAMGSSVNSLRVSSQAELAKSGPEIPAASESLFDLSTKVLKPQAETTLPADSVLPILSTGMHDEGSSANGAVPHEGVHAPTLDTDRCPTPPSALKIPPSAHQNSVDLEAANQAQPSPGIPHSVRKSSVDPEAASLAQGFYKDSSPQDLTFASHPTGFVLPLANEDVLTGAELAGSVVGTPPPIRVEQSAKLSPRAPAAGLADANMSMARTTRSPPSIRAQRNGTSSPLAPGTAIDSGSVSTEAKMVSSAAETPSPVWAKQNVTSSSNNSGAGTPSTFRKPKRRPLGQADSPDRQKRRKVVEVIISPTRLKPKQTGLEYFRLETPGPPTSEGQPAPSQPHRSPSSKRKSAFGSGVDTGNRVPPSESRRSSARLKGAPQLTETPTPKPSTVRTGGELAAAASAAFAYTHRTTGSAWERSAKAAARAGVDEPVYGPDNLDFVRAAPSKVFAAHYADARNVHAQNAPGRGLGRTDLEEILDRGGRVVEKNGVKQLPNVPKAPLTQILDATRSEAPVPGARGMDDLIASRMLDKYTLRARHHAGAGHTTEVKFARVLDVVNGGESQPQLLLASSHFTVPSPQYNKAGGIVLVDVTCTGWQDDEKGILRVVGEPNADTDEPPTSHVWKHPSGQDLHAEVNDIAFSTNGFFLLSCSAREPVIKIWDTANGRLYGTGQKGYRPERGRKGAHWRNRSARFRDLGLQKVAVKQDLYTCIVAAASLDGSTHLMQVLIRKGRKEFENFHPELPAEETRYSERFRVATTVIFGHKESNNLLATGYERVRGNTDVGKVRIFDITESKLVTEYAVGDTAVACLAFCPDGRLLVAGATGNAPLPGEDTASFPITTGDGLVRIFDIREPGPVMELSSSQRDHNVVGFSPCGRYVYSCSDPGFGESRVPHTCMYDIRNTRNPVLCETMVLPHSAAQPGHEGDGVTCAAWHGNLFFTGGQDECVRAWDVRRNPADRIRRTFACKDGPITALALSPSGGDYDAGQDDGRLLPEWMAVGTSSGAVHLWALGEGRGVVEVWDDAVAEGRVAGEWVYSAD